MTEPRFCPHCHAEIPANAPAGLCPKCLLQAGLQSGSAADPQVKSTQPHTPQKASSEFVPLTPEELGARFPQLEILELLGRGGMGAVYKARQRGLDRLVAVKILPPDLGNPSPAPGGGQGGGEQAFAERFKREAKALAKLSHQHIVTIHDFGQADGLFYFVMEYVDGVNLRQAMQAGKIEPKQALSIVTQVCDALQFAHDEGIVHRDIKPANILIDKRGRVKIADFGLAKLLGQHQPDRDLTGTLQVMGTLRYMAPEQMEGSKAVDHRADIYSLGVVFYELLTGEVPMGRFAPPSKKVQVDVRLDEVVLRALEKEPELRYQQASAVKTDVEQIRSGSGKAVQPESIARAVKPAPLISVRFHVEQGWLRNKSWEVVGIVRFDGDSMDFEFKEGDVKSLSRAKVHLSEISSLSLQKNWFSYTFCLKTHRWNELADILRSRGGWVEFDIEWEEEHAAKELQMAVSQALQASKPSGEVKPMERQPKPVGVGPVRLISVPFHIEPFFGPYTEGHAHFDGASLEFAFRQSFFFRKDQENVVNVALSEINSLTLEIEDRQNSSLCLETHRKSGLAEFLGGEDRFELWIAREDETAAKELQSAVSEALKGSREVVEAKTDAEAISKAPPGKIVAPPAEQRKKPPGMEAQELEQLVLPLLPDKVPEATKLYQEKAGVGALQASLAVFKIMKDRGLKRPWRQTAAEGVQAFGILGGIAAAIIIGKSWANFLSPLVFYVLLLAGLTICTLVMRQFRGKRAGRIAGFAMGLIAYLAIWQPVFDFLEHPEGTLNWLYEATGMAPGPYDVAVIKGLHAAFIVVVAATFLWIVFLVFKVKLKHRAEMKPGDRVIAPSGWLIETGIVQIVTSLIWLPLSFHELLPWLTGLSVASAALGITVILGAIRMRRLESYRAARWTCFAAMVPSGGLGWLQGIPFGIWAWRTLKRPDVRIAFAEREKQMLAEVASATPGVPFRYYLKALFFFTLGWLLFPLLWNLREIGLAVSCVTMGLIVVWLGRGAARYLPATAEGRHRRSNALLIAFLCSITGAYLLFLGYHRITDRFDWNHLAESSDDFRQRYQGAEHRLLLALREFKADVPRAQLDEQGFNSVALDLGTNAPPTLTLNFATAFIWILLLLGLLLITSSFLIIQPRRGFVLAAPSVAALALVAFCFNFISSQSGGSESALTAPHDLETFGRLIEDWAKETGYQEGGSSAWHLRSIPQRQLLANVELRHFWKPNVFDRWGITVKGLRRKSPDLALLVVSSAKSKETVVKVCVATSGLDSVSLEGEVKEGLRKAIDGQTMELWY